jgi:hypothetical protein
MGCAAPVPMKVTISTNLIRSSVKALDNLYNLVEEVVLGLNKINAGLSVAVDKFETICGLHEPKRSLSIGVMSMLSFISHELHGNFLSVNFHLLDNTPGISLDFSKLSPEMSNCFQLWVAMNKEIETAVQDFSYIMPRYHHCVSVYTEIKKSFKNTEEYAKAAEIDQANYEMLKESVEFFGYVLFKIRGLTQELFDANLLLKKTATIAEILKIGDHINRRSLLSPSEVTEKLGSYIEQAVERIKSIPN